MLKVAIKIVSLMFSTFLQARIGDYPVILFEKIGNVCKNCAVSKEFAIDNKIEQPHTAYFH